MVDDIARDNHGKERKLMADYFYARVSAYDQNLERQLDAANERGIPSANVFTEKKTRRKVYLSTGGIVHIIHALIPKNKRQFCAILHVLNKILHILGTFEGVLGGDSYWGCLIFLLRRAFCKR